MEKLDNELMAYLQDHAEDLGISSIDMVSLIMDFEDTFHLTVSDEQLAKLRTVSDVQALIKG